MNILFLADPYSIHNIKWMSFIAKEHRVFLLIRKYHLPSMTESWILELTNKYHIRETAKSSAQHVLGNLYSNIHNTPQPETQPPPQSTAEKPTITIEKAHSIHISMMLLLVILKVQVMKG